jgi:hypothetical protein
MEQGKITKVALPVCINRANVTVLSLGHVTSCVSFVKSTRLARESLEVNAAGKMFPLKTETQRNEIV